MEFKKLPLDAEGKLIENNFRLQSPRNLVIVKYPKSGGTLALCDVPKVLIGDAEKGTEPFKAKNYANLLSFDGEEFISTKNYGWLPAGLFQTVDELSKVNNMKEFWALYGKLDSNLSPKEKEVIFKDVLAHLNQMAFPIFAIDTITSVLDVSNTAALYEYNKSISVDKRKSSIRDIDNWGGTYKIRHKFEEVKRFIENNAAPFIQWHGHVGERKKILKKSEEEITALDIALDGLMSTIFTAKADAVCTLYRNGEGVYLDFLKKDETALGSRNANVSNKLIKIADLMIPEQRVDVDRPKTYWKEVYPDLNHWK